MDGGHLHLTNIFSRQTYTHMVGYSVASKKATLYDISIICFLTAEMIEVQSDVMSKIVTEFEVNDASSVNMM